MAGDWIKMRSDLFTHPKVVRITSALKADRLRTVGGLMSVWCLFDAHSVDGQLEGYTLNAVDEMIGWPGFAAAMKMVGWLDEDSESLVLPEFDTHNGQSAKRRAQDSDRKRAERLSASEADKNGTREEKRREEKKETTNTKAPRAKRATRPSKTALPADFSISDRVREWAAENGHVRLEDHLDSFIRKARAKGYEYASWDDAFMEAIRGDWAGLKKQQGPPRVLSWSEKNDEVIAQLTGRNRDYEPDDRIIDI